jgi:hypothetical protein
VSAKASLQPATSPVPPKTNATLPNKFFTGSSQGSEFSTSVCSNPNELFAASSSAKNSETRSFSSNQGASAANLIQLIRERIYT